LNAYMEVGVCGQQASCGFKVVTISLAHGSVLKNTPIQNDSNSANFHPITMELTYDV